jgi:hypothetical protein
MTKFQYVSLNYEEKKELIRVNGSFLVEKQNETHGKRTIYALYGFFVEVSFDAEGHERYIRVIENYFESESSLEGVLINLN